MSSLALKARLEKMDSIPDGHEGDSKKKTKGSSKLCHQGGPRIDQLLSLHQGAVGDGPQGEEEVVGDKGADVLVPHQAVPLVVARLPAPRQSGDFLRFRVVHVMIETS